MRTGLSLTILIMAVAVVGVCDTAYGAYPNDHYITIQDPGHGQYCHYTVTDTAEYLLDRQDFIDFTNANGCPWAQQAIPPGDWHIDRDITLRLELNGSITVLPAGYFEQDRPADNTTLYAGLAVIGAGIIVAITAVIGRKFA